MTYIYLILEFFKTGLLAIGGGLATIPFLREIAEKQGWFTEGELVDMLAISESTPGPFGVNMATFAGFNTAGIPGGIIATLALVLPSVIIILLVARFMSRYGESVVAAGVFWAVRPAATGLIAGALFFMLMLTLQTETGFTPETVIIYAFLTTACFAAEYIPKLKRIKLHPVVFIAVGAVCGIALNLAQ